MSQPIYYRDDRLSMNDTLLALTRDLNLPTLVQYISTYTTPPQHLTECLTIAVEASRVDIARYLLQQGATIKNSIPQLAAETGCIAMFELFMEYGWRADDVKPNAYLQIHLVLPHAIEHADLTKWLLDNGADPNLGEPTWGDTSQPIPGSESLEAAAWQCNIPIFSLLLAYNADPNLCIALHIAAESCQPDEERISMMTYLVKIGFDVDGSDQMIGPACWGRPLHYAVRARNVGSVKFLLVYGADPLAKNRRGETAGEYAGRLRDPVLVELFEEWEEDVE